MVQSVPYGKNKFLCIKPFMTRIQRWIKLETMAKARTGNSNRKINVLSDFFGSYDSDIDSSFMDEKKQIVVITDEDFQKEKQLIPLRPNVIRLLVKDDKKLLRNPSFEKNDNCSSVDSIKSSSTPSQTEDIHQTLSELTISSDEQSIDNITSTSPEPEALPMPYSYHQNIPAVKVLNKACSTECLSQQMFIFGTMLKKRLL